MSSRASIVSVLAILGLVAAGCGDDDGAPVRTDSGTAPRDAGMVPRPDGMVPMTDAGGMVPTDGGMVPRTDAGMVPRTDGGMVPRRDGGDPTVPGSTGAACTMASDCTMLASAMCMTDIAGFYSFPGGYCTASCTMDSDCGAGGGCLTVPLVGGYCVKSCTLPTDCRTGEGYTCMAPPIGGTGGMYCLPPFMMGGGLPLDGGLPIP